MSWFTVMADPIITFFGGAVLTGVVAAIAYYVWAGHRLFVLERMVRELYFDRWPERRPKVREKKVVDSRLWED